MTKILAGPRNHAKSGPIGGHAGGATLWYHALMAEEESAHDVLAAEAFAVPGPDPDLSHRSVVLPEDERVDAEPHATLAAEEFPMPTPRHHVVAGDRRGPGIRGVALGAGAALATW